MAIEDTMSYVEDARTAAVPEAADLIELRKYALGTQKYALSAGETRILRNSLGHEIVDNLCAAALHALSNPLNIIRWDVAPSDDGTDGMAEAVSQFVDKTAMLNNLPTLQKRVTWATIRDRDHYVGLSWYVPTGEQQQNGRVLIQREAAWNGTQGVFAHYDDFDRNDWTLKEWSVSSPTRDGQSALRRTLWWPDRIERYIKDANDQEWQPYQLPEDGGWPVPWLDAQGQPLNPPIVHFANAGAPNDAPGDDSDEQPDSRYGRSALDGGGLGVQDAINSIHRDVLASAHFLGFPMAFLSGIQPQVVDGVEQPFVVEPGAVFRSSDPTAKGSILAAGNIDLLEQALMIELKAFSRLTGVPVHNFTGQWPSGTALILSMLDYFDRLQALADALAPTWGSVMHKATKLANVFGRAGLDEDAPITAVYAPVIRYDPLTQAEIVSAVSEFVSKRERLRLLNYSIEEQDKILEEIDEDRDSAPTPPPVIGPPDASVSTPVRPLADIGESITTNGQGGA
jgi:hypothetical protein